jgi:hypothetical protein
MSTSEIVAFHMGQDLAASLDENAPPDPDTPIGESPILTSEQRIAKVVLGPNAFAQWVAAGADYQARQVSK